METVLLLSLIVPLGITLVVSLQRLSNRSDRPLPPGPKPKFIVGNLGDLPPPGQPDWLHWSKFKEQYGPISSVTVLGQTIVVINDSRVAFDLLEKRSSLYSSRPNMVFAGELVGWDNILAMQKYSDIFRAYRKAMHRVLGTKNTIAQFNALQEVEVRRFLLRVLEQPDDLVQHIRTEAGAVILKIAYGYNIEPHGSDPLVDLANEALANFSAAGTPGAWMVDTMPFLKLIPGWFPGAGFKRTAAAWKNNLITTIEKPYRFVVQQMEQGKHPASYLSNLLEENHGKTLSAEEQQVIKWSAGSLYTGGADTTVSTLSCFFLAMALHPEVQKKAQEELDRVLGPNHLPTFEDRPNLPYIDAIVKEALRWHPVAPMGIPHMCTVEDVYKGYRIPKGSIIMPNIWAFTHDPEAYRDPMSFHPDRFLSDTPEPDPHNLSFGFGRRVCPGKLLADSTIFLSVAQSLAVFNFQAHSDGNTRAEFLPGVVSHPAPYQLKITPRSAAHEELIRSVAVDFPWEESDARNIVGI
ncbi:cytochrome P450 [Aspergillus egyptiacus]|nr:cytochrome P450 [Aspergillus egyptiacus]